MRLKLPLGTFKAYLFDCDGTIADSMPLHYVAWNKALSEWGCEFNEDLFYAWGGMPVAEIIATLNQKHGLNMPVQQVAKRKEDIYLESLPQLKAVPEVLEHIEASYKQIPFAVVSGSSSHSVTASLRTLNLLDRFEALVCAGDYQRPQPEWPPSRFPNLEKESPKNSGQGTQLDRSRTPFRFPAPEGPVTVARHFSGG